MTSDDTRSTRSTRNHPYLGLLLPREHGSARFVPILLGLLVVAFTTFIARHQWASEHHALEAATESALREVSSAVQGRMRSQVDALARLRSNWVSQGALTKETFDRNAGSLVRDFEHIRAIEWVDRDYVIRWMARSPGFESHVGIALGRSDEELRAFDEASRRDGPSMSPPTRLVNGDLGFVIAFPLVVDGEFDGFLLGVYGAEDTFGAMLSHVATSYDVTVAGSRGPLWSRATPDSDPRYTRSSSVEMLTQTWLVSVTPVPELVSTYLTPLPALILAGSIVMGLLFATVLRGAWMGRLRNQRLRQANARLASEVTRRTQAEAAEKAARDELSTVVNSLPAYVWSAATQPDGSLKMRYQSRFIETITGLPMEVFEEGEEWVQCIHPDDRERMVLIFERLVSGEIEEDASEFRVLRADGDVRFVRQRVRAAEVAEGRRVEGVTIDFTELQRAEEERARLEARMQEAQRLESLGGLAGGIAHDFNNLLVAMLGHAHLAREDLELDHPARRSLSSIERAARRAADLCRQMLAYAGMGTVVEERIDLCDVVEEMQDLLRASIPRTIVLNTELGDESAGVEADPSQLRQVVLNLITNAAEAIGDGPGRIDVRVSLEDFGADDLDGLLLGEELAPGRYVALRVRDDGCGMDDETRRRIFEPFFSTKFQGRGLGLAAVLGIVRRCRGALGIESAPGRGTTMTVLLHPVELPAEVSVSPRTPIQTELGGDHVLLVEDDDAARDFAAIVLERAGYEVSQAADGVEGLELFEKHLQHVRCVVLDLTMPRMDGVETARRIRALAPDVALVLSSGYPEADALQRFGALGITEFLQKPYEPHRLVEAVDAALRARTPGAVRDGVRARA